MLGVDRAVVERVREVRELLRRVRGVALLAGPPVEKAPETCARFTLTDHLRETRGLVEPPLESPATPGVHVPSTTQRPPPSPPCVHHPASRLGDSATLHTIASAVAALVEWRLTSRLFQLFGQTPRCLKVRGLNMDQYKRDPVVALVARQR